MKKMTWFEKLRRKEHLKENAIVADPGLPPITSSITSLIRPSRASFQCPPEPSPVPEQVEEWVDSISNATASKFLWTPAKTTSSALTDLWKKAIQALQDDPDSEKRELAQQYAEILASELSGPGGVPGAEGPSHLKHEQVAERLNAKVEELTQERLTISVGSRELAIEPLFNNVSKHIIAARDLINSATGAEPHAALACAGGLVILTFLVRPIEQREHILRGLELTSSLICRYFAMEQVYRPRARIESLPVESARRLELDLEHNLVNLYTKIIEFQARALCYLQRSRPTRFIRDMFRGDTWKTLIEEIERLDAQCRAFADLVTHEKILVFLESNSQGAERAIVAINSSPPISDELLRKQTKLLNKLYTCPYRDRKDMNPERAPGTCEWFTKHEYFRDWKLKPESRILWVSADPGAGKSVLAKYLADTVLSSTSDRTTSYFFFKDGFHDQERAPAAMCAILRQIFQQHTELMDDTTVAKFEADGNHLVNSFTGLFDILIEASTRVNTELICLLDADECNEDGCRQITATLAKFYRQPPGSSRLKFIITSRPYSRIQRSLQSLESLIPTIHLRGDDESNSEKISGEIGIVIRHRLRNIAQIQLLAPHEIILLEKVLLTWQHRTYLWVKLAMDFIENRLESPTEDNVQDILRSVPEELDGLYEQILERSTNKDQASHVLHLIVGAYRPMSLAEVSVALFIDEKQQKTCEISKEPIDRFSSYLREICGLFVTIVEGNVYLLHETAREFLMKKAGPYTPTPTWLHSVSLEESHFLLARACVWYLLLANAECDMNPGLARVDGAFSEFRDYALNYWTLHVKEVEKTIEIDAIEDMVIQLCWTGYQSNQRITNLRSDVEAAHRNQPGTTKPRIDTHVLLESTPHNPITIATIFGFEFIVLEFLARHPRIGRDVDPLGRTLLWWAAWAGRSNIIVRLLTENDDDEYAESSLNRPQLHSTPLVIAIHQQHRSAVQTLLRDPRTCVGTHCGRKPSWTPLHYAVIDEKLFSLLISDQRTFSNWTDGDYHELLAHTLSCGKIQLYKSLLHNGHLQPIFSRPDPRDGRTAFCKLADPGQPHLNMIPGVVCLDLMKYLIEVYQMDYSRPDHQNRSPVSWAAGKIQNAVVLSHLLFDLHLEPDDADKQGRTPLSYSAEVQETENMEVLLQTNRVRLNSTDIHGRTPLMMATGAIFLELKRNYRTIRRYEEAAFLLLHYGADVNIRDARGRTVLTYAAMCNMSNIVKALIGRGAAVNSQDTDGRTALSFAVEFASDEVVSVLLNARADPWLADNKGNTPRVQYRPKLHPLLMWLDDSVPQGQPRGNLTKGSWPDHKYRAVKSIPEGCISF